MMKIKNKSTSRSVCLIAATTISSLISLPLQAQEDELEKIIVTAEKLGKTLQETQASVVVLRGDILEKQSVLDLEEALLRVGNVDLNTKGDLSIRGIGKQGPTGGIPTNRTVLGYYIDGVALSEQAQRFALSNWDVGQVEVLRGPVTTVQGRNSLAGAVLLNTNDPEYYWGGKARLSYGQNNSLQTSVAVTGPLLDDKLAVRFSVDHSSSDGEIINSTLQDKKYGQSDATTIRGKLLFEPEDFNNLSATLAFSKITADKTDGQVEVIGPDFESRIAIAASPTIAKADGISMISLNMDYELSDSLDLKSVTAYQNSDVTNIGPFQESDSQNEQRVIFGSFNDQLLTQEFLLTYRGDNWSTLTGLYYSHVENEQDRGGVFEAGILNTQLLGLDASSSAPLKEEIINYATFIDISYQPTEQLELQAGLRVDYEENNFFRSTTGVRVEDIDLSIIPPLPESNSSASGSELLPKLGAVYSVNKDLSLGLIYSRGYRPGGSGVNIIEVLRTGSPEFFNYDAEYTDNYEFSFRSQWFNRTVTANVNAYYIDWQEQQVSVYGSFGSSLDDTTITNAGSSSVQGFELELSTQLDAFDLYSSIGYSKTKFDKFISNESDYSGNEFARSPNLTASAGGAYSFNNGIYFSANLSYTGKSWEDNENTLELPGYTLVNLNMSYEMNNYRAFIFVKNLFDKVALTRLTYEGDLQFGRLRESRQVGAGIEMTF
ncbi:TonB-dependent receptor [Colwellia sp. 6_MG-2023]|jgi:outer membrane receptor protein involved in Fe transport|uniref:TonB-dependent receptor n=1 Tax=Colwellia sp. 6_MG-2023 TaxID=3062676 RepID=UPI0026E12116|nr:TonB-dependent receptor [Colwellia sp. 6_MG-2023]MDO6489239.1 TonB-dependent receptor [Colwellia sp. 6_MG-2023]